MRALLTMAVPMGLAALALAGCDLAEKFPVLPPPTNDTGPDTETIVTKVNNDQASIVVTQFLPHTNDTTMRTQARAMFVENVQNTTNLAQCVGMRDLWCAYEPLPQNDGEVLRVEPFDKDIVGNLLGRKVTNDDDDLPFGPLNLRFATDSSVDVPFYTRSYTDVELDAEGLLSLTVSGDWDDWTGDTIEAPTPMVLTSHDPTKTHAFPSAEPLLLEWEPGTVGDVYLYFRGTNGQFVQRLDDDGSAELDLNVFALQDGDPVDFYIGRWSIGDVDIEGHELNVQVQSNQWIHGEYTALGNRTELDDGLLYDNCAEAEGAPFVGSGLYYGDLRGYTNDYQGYQSCLNGPAAGPDAVLPMRLQADELLQVEFIQRNDDAVMYLVEGLCDGTPQCLTGVDDKGRSVQESLAYRNPSGGPLDVWLVLDAVGANLTDIFELNVGIETAVANPLQSTCAGALAQGPIDEGAYYGVMGTFPNLLDCTPVDENGQVISEAGAVGGDGKVELYLLPNQTLTAEVFAPGANPTAYLVFNCALSISCLETPGAVTAASDTVTLTYTNASAVSEHVYLVVDSGVSAAGGAVQDYFLDIEIQ